MVTHKEVGRSASVSQPTRAEQVHSQGTLHTPMFSKADLASGYWHVKLDEESSLNSDHVSDLFRQIQISPPAIRDQRFIRILQKKFVEAL